jgi:hypothetical protein
LAAIEEAVVRALMRHAWASTRATGSRYHDRMVKVDGEWRIKSRVNRISYASGDAAEN